MSRACLCSRDRQDGFRRPIKIELVQVCKLSLEPYSRTNFFPPSLDPLTVLGWTLMLKPPWYIDPPIHTSNNRSSMFRCTDHRAREDSILSAIP